jgi:hypothetical protein
MSSNVINLSNYRSETQRTAEEAAAKAAELSTMSYDALLDWAGFDFDRLCAVARAKDYRPEWISHQLTGYGIELTPAQAGTLARMIADAGEYLSRRHRWILRQLRSRPMQQQTLSKLAADAQEYRPYKQIPKCVAHDLAKLAERGLIRHRDGGCHWAITDARESGGAAKASTPL